jgi:hypothetical protein
MIDSDPQLIDALEVLDLVEATMPDLRCAMRSLWPGVHVRAGGPRTNLLEQRCAALAERIAAAETDLAQGKAVTSSSETVAHPNEHAVDGLASTSWSTTDGATTAWIQIDLGSVHWISHVKLHWGVYYARVWTWDIAVTPGDWETSRMGGATAPMQKEEFDCLDRARHVRLSLADPPGLARFSMVEIELWGEPA